MRKEEGKPAKFHRQCFEVENEVKVVECSRLNCVGVWVVK